jgi:hypothetical protein
MPERPIEHQQLPQQPSMMNPPGAMFGGKPA